MTIHQFFRSCNLYPFSFLPPSCSLTFPSSLLSFIPFNLLFSHCHPSFFLALVSVFFLFSSFRLTLLPFLLSSLLPSISPPCHSFLSSFISFTLFSFHQPSSSPVPLSLPPYLFLSSLFRPLFPLFYPLLSSSAFTTIHQLSSSPVPLPFLTSSFRLSFRFPPLCPLSYPSLVCSSL